MRFNMEVNAAMLSLTKKIEGKRGSEMCPLALKVVKLKSRWIYVCVVNQCVLLKEEFVANTEQYIVLD